MAVELSTIATKVRRPFSQQMRVGIIGDSIDTDGYSVIATMHSGMLLLKNAAAGGDTVSIALNKFDSEFLNLNPNVIIVKIGTNDASAGLNIITFMNDFDLLIKKILNKGAVPFVVFPPPRIASGTLEIHQIRMAQEVYCKKNNIFYSDPFEFVMDIQTGLAVPSFYLDNVHPNSTTQIQAGTILAESLKNIFNTSFTRPKSQLTSGVYNNPLLFNNSGGVAAGFPTPAGFTPSIVSNDPDFVGNAQQYQVVGTNNVTVIVNLGSILPNKTYLVSIKIKLLDIAVDIAGLNFVLSDNTGVDSYNRVLQPRNLTVGTESIIKIHALFNSRPAASSFNFITSILSQAVARNYKIRIGEIQAWEY